ncbi:endonuclease [Lysobacter arseniciresistens ZS79]|uniref:Endonuclease n=2 Tax=Novilysobacter TaxID=3382699 RepID=A0A0A0F3C7_9GAMM|nr:endonuclease [Lysobacter arseniciresistens ZS79]
MLTAASVLAGLLLAPALASAWGPQGHRLVAALAWDELDPRARARVEQLLAGESDPTLPGIANWADDLRGNDPDIGRRSARWHYVNIAGQGCRYDAASACAGGDCVVEAIRAQAAVLGDPARPLEERRQALKFVVHFVGDVHQPMHAGYGHDKGGNDVQLRMPDGRGGNLHRLWDSGLLNTAELDDAAYLARLRALPLAVPAGTGPADWAEASCEVVVRPGVYVASGAAVDDDYVQAWLPVAEAQLRRGGSQLAGLLNRVLGG